MEAMGTCVCRQTEAGPGEGAGAGVPPHGAVPTTRAHGVEQTLPTLLLPRVPGDPPPGLDAGPSCSKCHLLGEAPPDPAPELTPWLSVGAEYTVSPEGHTEAIPRPMPVPRRTTGPRTVSLAGQPRAQKRY